MAIDISIIIVNYNTLRLTSECIDSVIEKTHGIKYEIILVDNSSTDGSKEFFENDSRVKYIYSDENLGFGRANNEGAKQASGKYLFFLNSDTILKNDVLPYFIEAIESDHCVGVVGAILVDAIGIPTHSYGKFITIQSEIKRGINKYLEAFKIRNKIHPEVQNQVYPIEVDYITGADMFIPKSLFEMVNGFDPTFFMYCEEVDLQERISRLGYKRIIISGPQIVHLEGGSDNGSKKKWSFYRHLNVVKSKNIYIKKRHNKFLYSIYKLLNSVILIPTFIVKKLPVKQRLELVRAVMK